MKNEKSLLLHWPENMLKPVGGPSGYLYNLYTGLKAIKPNEYELLPPVGEETSGRSWLKSVVPSRIKDLRRLYRLMGLPDKHLEAPLEYNFYDYVHFHSTEDLYLHRDALTGYQGAVLLTSHSPCVPYKELLSRLNVRDVARHKERLAQLEQIDCFAFERADYIIFPCPEAEEPYYHTWPAYEDLRKADKIRYVPTGIQSGVVKKPRQAIRSHYGIPEDGFVVTYVGRHNEIKGYGELLKCAPKILADYENVWFLVAGKEGPLYGLDHPRWVEAGWTNDPHSIIAAADMFVLPNRETYFDLVLLEVLSLGQNVVITNTGGNKYFSRFKAPGIQIVNNMSELEDKIYLSMAASLEERGVWGSENKRLFEDNFTCEEFARRYAEVIDGLK